MMNKILEGLATFNLMDIGIQKHLLVSSLLGTLLNLPKNVKNKFHKAALILISTTMSTILTPLVIEILGNIGMKISQGSSFAIAGLVGIVGISTLRKFLIDKLNNNTKKDEQ